MYDNVGVLRNGHEGASYIILREKKTMLEHGSFDRLTITKEVNINPLFKAFFGINHRFIIDFNTISRFIVREKENFCKINSVSSNLRALS